MARSSPRSTATRSCCLMLRRSTSRAGCRVTPTRFGRSGSRTAARCWRRAPPIAPPSCGTSPPANHGSSCRATPIGAGRRLQPRRQHAVHSRLDDVVLTWDLLGDRRFMPRLLLAEPGDTRPRRDRLAQRRRRGLRNRGGRRRRRRLRSLLQFLDLGTGRAGPMIDTGHHCYGSFKHGGRTATASPPPAMTGSFASGTGARATLIVERHVAPEHITGLGLHGRRPSDWWSSSNPGATYAIDAETLEPDGTPIQLDGVVQNVLRQPGQPHRRRPVHGSRSRWSTSTTARSSTRARPASSLDRRLLPGRPPIRGRRQLRRGARARRRNRQVGRSAHEGPHRGCLLRGLRPRRCDVRHRRRRTARSSSGTPAPAPR